MPPQSGSGNAMRSSLYTGTFRLISFALIVYTPYLELGLNVWLWLRFLAILGYNNGLDAELA